MEECLDGRKRSTVMRALTLNLMLMAAHHCISCSHSCSSSHLHTIILMIILAKCLIVSHAAAASWRELRVLQRVLSPPVEPALESSREEEAVLFRDRGASSACKLAVRFILFIMRGASGDLDLVV